MNPRVFQDVARRELQVPPSRASGAHPKNLHRQIARCGAAVAGVPILEVSRGTDGELMINDGVTRATRVAKLLPGTKVVVEIIDDLPIQVGYLPKIESLLP